MHTRSFTVESVQKIDGHKINFTGGRYLSETPIGSVKKMFSKIIQSLPRSKISSLKITLRETTQDSKHKEYTYKVTKKHHVTTIERDGKEITYHYVTKVKSI